MFCITIFLFLFNCICYYGLLLCLLCVSISVPILVAVCFLYLDDTPIGLFPFVFTLPSVVKPIKIKIKLVRKTGLLSIYWHKMAKLLRKPRQFSPA